MEANYSTGDTYHYTYDAVGNRQTQEKMIIDLLTTDSYNYDDANRLTDVNGVTYTFDANGNLLNDGVNAYTYDSANRLKSVSNQSSVSSYQYNGLGDRISQTVNSQTTTYTLDLNAGLTQVLNDGTNTYLYGLGRIAQVNTSAEYFLGDALGSVRQLTNTSGNVMLAKSYAPYGETLSSAGSGTSLFAYAGEQQDANGLTYLRARYYASGTGRFLTRDTWAGDANIPLSFNRWNYVYGNPITYHDPSGHVPTEQEIIEGRHVYSCNCGWIDLAHANPKISNDMFKLINARPNIPNSIRVREDVLLVSLRRKVAGPLDLSPDIVVKTTLSNQAKKEVGLGMFMARAEIMETWQLLAPWTGTSFSEEDLVSDLIGFYMNDLGMTEGARTNDNSFRWLAKKCGFPEDREKAKQWSLDVFESYPGFEQVKEWKSPRLACQYDSQCGIKRAWPFVFTTIVPQKPSVNGNWWQYRGWDYDGRFFGTEIPDVYLLEKRN